MSALDNVMTGEHARLHANILDSLLHTPAQRREERRVARASVRIAALRRTRTRRRTVRAATCLRLQRRLEIARALGGEPQLLLLDEPAAGMNPQEKADLIALIRRIRDRGVTIFLIEHDMRLVNEISERITVLDHGEKIAEGTPDEIRRDPRVIEAYLGARRDEWARGRGTRRALRAHHGARRDLAARRRGRDRGADRRERRGQDARPCARSAGWSGRSAGRIAFDGRDLPGVAPRRDRAPRRRALARGAARVRADDACARTSRWARSRARDRAGIAADTERVLATFPRLSERLDQKAGTMSGGEQQMLAIGRALMSPPAPAAARRAVARTLAGRSSRRSSR